MRATDDRYRAERERLDLALKLIGHEARTGTIRQLTGLSDDRIRRLYGSYFKHRPGNRIRRRRGRTPSQVAMFVKSPLHRFHAASLASAFVANGLLGRRRGVAECDNRLDTGQRLCRAYERYLQMHQPLLSFEWAWNLLASLRAADELAVGECPVCAAHYVHDALALDEQQCPSCLLLQRQGPSAQLIGTAGDPALEPLCCESD